MSASKGTNALRSTWLVSELKIPDTVVMTGDEERHLGRRIQTGIKRLLGLLLHHPAGARNMTRLLQEVAEGTTWMHGWAAQRKRLPRDVAKLARWTREADEAEPGRAAQLRHKVRKVFLSYPITPELAMQWAGEVSAAETEPGEEHPQRLARIVGRIAARLTRDRNRMMIANTRLVLHNLAHVHTRGLLRSDLFQEGVIGLSRAALRFDPKRNLKFSTYATFWVKQFIRNCLLYKSQSPRDKA